MKTLESFRLFLDAIKHERTSIVQPDYFTRLFNLEQMNWLKDKAPEGEVVQERIDDLEQLRVSTDGFVHNGHILNPITPETGNKLQFCLPKHYGETDHALRYYPTYFRLLNASFILTYTDTIASGANFSVPKQRDSVEWEPADIMRSDKRVIASGNYYRRVKEGRIYYEIKGKSIFLIAPENAVGKLLRLEYYRYPVVLYLDETNLSDHTSESGFPYNPGYGSIPCELPDTQTIEIINRCAATYLERNSEQRLQSFSQMAQK